MLTLVDVYLKSTRVFVSSYKFDVIRIRQLSALIKMETGNKI